ncbi:hypothetical protein VKT23_014428 [Stygiomarasmius scandens]|uniref:Uncharacterized protein n=1 Tax=Marasmiellus scandens TaxID=2682957 RepID=A0ABR1J0M7_9AGAR
MFSRRGEDFRGITRSSIGLHDARSSRRGRGGGCEGTDGGGVVTCDDEGFGIAECRLILLALVVRIRTYQQAEAEANQSSIDCYFDDRALESPIRRL